METNTKVDSRQLELSINLKLAARFEEVRDARKAASEFSRELTRYIEDRTLLMSLSIDHPNPIDRLELAISNLRDAESWFRIAARAIGKSAEEIDDHIGRMYSLLPRVGSEILSSDIFEVDKVSTFTCRECGALVSINLDDYSEDDLDGFEEICQECSEIQLAWLRGEYPFAEEIPTEYQPCGENLLRREF